MHRHLFAIHLQQVILFILHALLALSRFETHHPTLLTQNSNLNATTITYHTLHIHQLPSHEITQSKSTLT